jgi:hypothetical protein|tara:strand:+ start:26281 stop:27534 length:1254 start_codon:yes stop_codon:yes gene_type:complete
MIYIIDKPYNQGLYVQWVDMLKATNLPYESIVIDNLEIDMNFDEYLSKQKQIDYINSKCKPEDTLIIDSSFTRKANGEHLPYPQLYEFSKKLNSENIIVMHPDTGYSANDAYSKNKLKIISPTYSLKNWSDDTIKDSYNFYLFNGGYQDIRWLSKMVFHRYEQMLRAKKFLSHNGVYKIQRTLIQKTLEDNDLMKDSFFSYNAYNIFDENCNHNKDWEIDYKNFTQILFNRDVNPSLRLDEFIEQDIKPYYTNEEHEALLKQLPVVLDYIPNLSNVDQYAFTLPYTSNSYVEIIGCTSLSGDGDEIYTSEKIFKPFMAFLIPIFIGQKGLIEVLQKLGFKLDFDGLIDLSYDKIDCHLTRTKMALENVKEIGKLSIKQLHSRYWRCREDLQHNQELMKSLSHRQVSAFREIINKQVI